jgi:hypothetical protein
MSLDGALIDEATAGINAPSDGDQNAIVRVDNAQAPDVPNLRYQSVDSFLLEMAMPLANVLAAAAEAPPGSTSSNSFGVDVDLPLTEGYVYELAVNGVGAHNSGAILFREVQRVMASYPEGGPPVVDDTEVIYTNSGIDWTLAVSIDGTNLRATITNDAIPLAAADVTIGIVRARPIPAFL